MSRMKKAGMLALSLVALGVLPGVAMANGAHIKSGSANYTGAVNARLSSATAVLTTLGSKTITCTSATGTNPRLGSFGTGTISNSAVTNVSASKGNLSKLSFGNPLLAGTSPNVHDTTTNAFASGTPACPSTISGITSCVAQTPSTTNAVNALTNGTATSPGTGGYIELSLNVALQCNSGTITCTYSTYKGVDGSGNPIAGPVRSDLIAYQTSGTATAKFTNVTVYRSSGSATCPASGTFSASYQLFTGSVYPGGAGIYLAKDK